MQSRIAVVGDKDSVLAFKAAGADVFDASTPEQARQTLKQLRDSHAVIFITEELAAGLSDVLEKAKIKPYPIIVPIPSASSNTGVEGLGIKGLKKDIEKAIGTDIIFKDK